MILRSMSQVLIRAQPLTVSYQQRIPMLTSARFNLGFVVISHKLSHRPVFEGAFI